VQGLQVWTILYQTKIWLLSMVMFCVVVRMQIEIDTVKCLPNRIDVPSFVVLINLQCVVIAAHRPVAKFGMYDHGAI